MTGLGDEVEALLASGDEAALIAHIDETMQETGYSTNASRSPTEIARRLKEKLALAKRRARSGQRFDVLREFLSLEHAARRCAGGTVRASPSSRPDARWRALAVSMRGWRRLAMPASISALITYRAAFGRPLDYYTGLVFEIAIEGSSAVLAGGGRFDRLMTLLGARTRIPAVGFSLWLDRIETLASERAPMTITIALPSKGRMKDDASAHLRDAPA